MIEIQEGNVRNQMLKPYIKGYGRLKLNSRTIHAKKLLPWTASSWLFVNQPFIIDNENFNFSCLVGIRDTPSRFTWNTDCLEVLSVKFSSSGLSRFIRMPIYQLKNKVVDPGSIWNRNRINRLNARILKASSLEKKIVNLETFLISLLTNNSLTESNISHFADQIKNNPSIDIAELKRSMPLSSRHVERRFKELIGVNMQTFVRICRFDYAKTQLMRHKPSKLTTLGYESGYFDQAHFSKEFKNFSLFSPKHFPKNYPLYNLMAKKNCY